MGCSYGERVKESILPTEPQNVTERPPDNDHLAIYSVSHKAVAKNIWEVVFSFLPFLPFFFLPSFFLSLYRSLSSANRPNAARGLEERFASASKRSIQVEQKKIRKLKHVFSWILPDKILFRGCLIPNTFRPQLQHWSVRCQAYNSKPPQMNATDEVHVGC